MGRVFEIRGWAVYVYAERRSPHHMPHCHVKKRGTSIAVVELITGELLYAPSEDVPSFVLDELVTRIEDCAAEWERLNGGEGE